MIRKATAVWNGSGKEGNGHLSTPSTVLNKTQYSFTSRFEDGVGTNPEELMAAAHAGCFNMKLSFVLGNHGFTPDELHTECKLTHGDNGITKSELICRAKVPGIDAAKFAECAEDAKQNCPVSKAYNMEIVMDASLV
ncbi:MAG: OsmC family protein [Flavipsychrobacter sp.]